MLGYVVVPADAKPGGDNLLAGLAAQLGAEGLRLCGTVQENSAPSGDCSCDMDLRLLHDGRRIRISQALGAGATGCRLDAGALEEAARAVADALSAGSFDLLILNKFGKQEGMGRGFCPVIAAAVDAGVPVLLTVAEDALPDFLGFAGPMAEALDASDAGDWARNAALARA